MKQIDKLLLAARQAVKRICTRPAFVDRDEQADRLRAEGFEGAILVGRLPEDDLDGNGFGYGVSVHGYYATHNLDGTPRKTMLCA